MLAHARISIIKHVAFNLRPYTLLLLVCMVMKVSGQKNWEGLRQIQIDSGVTLTFDEPENFDPEKPLNIIVYALPNGNSTAQSFGKKMEAGDDWHFDIQHIGAQTRWIRMQDRSKNYIVVYAENTLKSWPAWRKKFTDADARIANLIKLIGLSYSGYTRSITLVAHSGGGSFLFGFINAFEQIPSYVTKIAFLDADYGYETGLHRDKLQSWLKQKAHRLELIAYNDSVVVYNGKPLVSPTGGTWYRTKLMAADLKLKLTEMGDRLLYTRRNVEAQLIKNPEGKVYHTVLVEKNGFIHSLFSGTRFANAGYTFWGERAYKDLIR